LAAGFAEVLDLADEIILLPIYPARELPIQGVDSEMILRAMKNQDKTIMNKEELLAWINNKFLKNINREFGEVLITAGAGDIDMLVEPIKKILENI
jgi:UDP-N-acetylmuramate--alanine ligase